MENQISKNIISNSNLSKTVTSGVNSSKPLLSTLNASKLYSSSLNLQSLRNDLFSKLDDIYSRREVLYQNLISVEMGAYYAKIVSDDISKIQNLRQAINMLDPTVKNSKIPTMLDESGRAILLNDADEMKRVGVKFLTVYNDFAAYLGYPNIKVTESGITGFDNTYAAILSDDSKTTICSGNISFKNNESPMYNVWDASEIEYSFKIANRAFSGNGTKNSPYYIRSYADAVKLGMLAHNTPGTQTASYYELLNDITLDSSGVYYLYGNIYGNGHSIIFKTDCDLDIYANVCNDRSDTKNKYFLSIYSTKQTENQISFYSHNIDGLLIYDIAPVADSSGAYTTENNYAYNYKSTLGSDSTIVFVVSNSRNDCPRTKFFSTQSATLPTTLYTKVSSFYPIYTYWNGLDTNTMETGEYYSPDETIIPVGSVADGGNSQQSISKIHDSSDSTNGRIIVSEDVYNNTRDTLTIYVENNIPVSVDMGSINFNIGTATSPKYTVLLDAQNSIRVPLTRIDSISEESKKSVSFLYTMASLVQKLLTGDITASTDCLIVQHSLSDQVSILKSQELDYDHNATAASESYSYIESARSESDPNYNNDYSTNLVSLIENAADNLYNTDDQDLSQLDIVTTAQEYAVAAVQESVTLIQAFSKSILDLNLYIENYKMFADYDAKYNSRLVKTLTIISTELMQSSTISVSYYFVDYPVIRNFSNWKNSLTGIYCANDVAGLCQLYIAQEIGINGLYPKYKLTDEPILSLKQLVNNSIISLYKKNVFRGVNTKAKIFQYEKILLDTDNITINMNAGTEGLNSELLDVVPDLKYLNYIDVTGVLEGTESYADSDVGRYMDLAFTRAIFSDSSTAYSKILKINETFSDIAPTFKSLLAEYEFRKVLGFIYLEYKDADGAARLNSVFSGRYNEIGDLSDITTIDAKIRRYISVWMLHYYSEYAKTGSSLVFMVDSLTEDNNTKLASYGKYKSSGLTFSGFLYNVNADGSNIHRDAYDRTTEHNQDQTESSILQQIWDTVTDIWNKITDWFKKVFL